MISKQQLDAWKSEVNDLKQENAELRKESKELKILRKGKELALELAIGYDGFNTVDGLKSLVDDICDVLRGDHKWKNMN